MKNANLYDLCIIGGGINGAGIARDAAMRGLRVILLEQDDLASATSSASTKLVHGGLRYLEFYEFSLVRESLREREKLLGIAPHIIWPLDFVLPHANAVRPLWMIRAGLFLYDFLGGKKKIKSSRYVNLRKNSFGKPLKTNFAKGFSYSDCWVQDARLVVLNAMDARDKGADILTRHKATQLHHNSDQNLWTVTYENNLGETFKCSARSVVNTSGPWVQTLLQEQGIYERDPSTPHLKLVKGSHIIVPQIFEGAQAYILQQNDGRIVFAIPYENHFTLIGTTDIPVGNEDQKVEISNSEKEYLCDAVNAFFQKQTMPQDIMSTYSGVRALLDDGNGEARKITRDYLLHHHIVFNAPIISVFGGKITTYRKLSENVLDMLLPLLSISSKCKTAEKFLPGGDIPHGDAEVFQQEMKKKYGWISDEMLQRFTRHYGTRMDRIFGDAHSLDDLGIHFGGDVYEAELQYLYNQEFARTAEDVLWRRTKLGLHLDDNTIEQISKYMNGL